MRILMVCLGNICRSPLAEGILKQKIIDNGLNWEVDSAGTSSYHSGESPHPQSIAVALQHNIDIREQRSRQFKKADFKRYDLILAMDESNYRNITRLASTNEEKNKVKLILSFSANKDKLSVPDPYYGEDGFENVFATISEACTGLIQSYSP
jgi:protein-tyrosine phosphatase